MGPACRRPGLRDRRDGGGRQAVVEEDTSSWADADRDLTGPGHESTLRRCLRPSAGARMGGGTKSGCGTTGPVAIRHIVVDGRSHRRGTWRYGRGGGTTLRRCRRYLPVVTLCISPRLGIVP